MGDASQLQLNPMALFDPSQWSNPYSAYQSSALPGASYAGWPTDYAGNPIGKPPGMTLFQTPSQPAPAAAAAPAASSNPQYIGPSNPGYNPNPAPLNYGASGADNGGGYGRGISGGVGTPFNQGPPQAPAPAAPATAAPAPYANPAGLTSQQYMQLRANPGPIPTYGATVPQSPSSAQPGSGVLQSFLQNWKPAASGPGSGFQQGFSHALKGMGYS